MKRRACGGCGSTDLEVFLDLGSTPLADTFPATATELERWFPLQVAVCPTCWLAQLTEVVDDDLLFGGDYGFYTGASPSAVSYFREYADWAMATFPAQVRSIVAEVACNDGTLLRHFADAGCQTLGVEPAKGPASQAMTSGLDVIAEPFTLALARQIVGTYGRAGLVVANNVAAHVADLDDFFAGVAALTAPEGVAVVEVQNLVDLIAGNQFDHVYHEHRFFFTASTLTTVMARHGLGAHSVIRTQAQGGSIRVVAGHDAQVFDVAEPWLCGEAPYRAMQGRVDRTRERLHTMIDAELGQGREVAGYGATAKSATLLNYCGIGPDRVSRIVDVTPCKIGRYTPGTKIPIAAPGYPPPDTYLLLAWNYLSGVLHRELEFVQAGGRFIVPIPYPVLL